MAAAPPPTAPPPQGRRVALWAAMLLVPVLVLALAEAGLRLAGYGHDLEPLFVAAPDHPDYLQPNPRAVTRLFADPAAAPAVSIETGYFRERKAAGALRVFVQGESTAAGFPYGLGASLAGQLQQRLQRAFPDREVEVISTALAAVNSYALVDFQREILQREPDAVVIYVGHNEYLGILGVGSTLRLAGSPVLTRVLLALRELRLFQALQRLLAAVVPAAVAPVAPGQDSLMARVAGERAIPLDSRLYRAGVSQFRHNLRRLLAGYREAGVPVLIGTLASNEADQPPLGEDGGDAPALLSARDEARLALERGEAAAALRAAERLVTLDGRAARGHWLRARALLAMQRFDEARVAFGAARDRDPLRFRAPAVFNAAVREVATDESARLVDTEAALRAAAPHGLLGHSLFLEHVHPNLDGYFILADAFYDALLAGPLAGQPAIEVDEATARAEVPVTAVDRWLGEFKNRRVTHGWPFVTRGTEPPLPAPASIGERLATAVYLQQMDWPQAQELLWRHHVDAGDWPEAARSATLLADAFPFAAPTQFEAAAALIRVARPLDAVRYAARATELEPRGVDGWLVLGHALALTGRRDRASAVLRIALALEPGNATARNALVELGATAVPATGSPP